jgi:hypothetical protein
MLLTTHTIIEATMMLYTFSVYHQATFSVNLRRLAFKEVAQVGGVLLLFFLELFTEWMNREYLFLIPVKLVLGEAYAVLYC